jgi:hypothetical protein
MLRECEPIPKPCECRAVPIGLPGVLAGAEPIAPGVSLPFGVSSDVPLSYRHCSPAPGLELGCYAPPVP